ncbi:MAG: hypothetical protein IJP72_03140 [Bacteroidales bacterium]|nr:hypothetical protein [Bacteroidales bacterium]
MMKRNFTLLILALCSFCAQAQTFIGTMTVDSYTRKNVTVKLQASSYSETCSITLYDVKFSLLMPVTVDVTIKPITNTNGQITGNNIVPTNDGKRYEKYTVRQLKGTVSSTKLQFSCQMGSKRLSYEGKKK